MIHSRGDDVKKLYVLVTTLGLLLCGCASTHTVRSISYEGMNELLSGREATMEMTDGRTVSGTRVQLVQDSIFWTNNRTGEIEVEPVHDLQNIVIVTKDVGLGMLEGFAIGLVGGYGAGYLVFLSSLSTHGDEGRSAAFLAGLLYGAPVGAGIGLLVGSAIGHSRRFEFQFSEGSGLKERTRVEGSDTSPLRLKDGRIEQTLNDFDAVLLKNGTVVRGTIIAETGDGEYLAVVTIRKWDGTLQTYDATVIKKIERQLK